MLTNNQPMLSLKRAVKVLEAVGLPPHAHDVWTEHLDVDFGSLPIIGQVK